MSSVSVIANITNNLPSTASTANSAAEQLTQGLKALSTAIQSGDTTGATAALTALTTAFAASNPNSVVSTNSLQAQGAITTMQQALGSGSSAAIQNAFTELQKDLSAATAPASPTGSAATPAYVLGLLSTLPNNADSSSATDIGSNLLSTLSTQDSVANTAALNLYA